MSGHDSRRSVCLKSATRPAVTRWTGSWSIRSVGKLASPPRVGERGISLWCHSGPSLYPPSRSHTEYSHIRRCCGSHTTYPRTLPNPLESQFYGTPYRGAADGTGHRSDPPGITPLTFDLTMGGSHPCLVDEPQWRLVDATPDRLADPIQSLAKAQS